MRPPETTPAASKNKTTMKKRMNKSAYIWLLCFSCILLINACKDGENGIYDPTLVEKTGTPAWTAPNEVEYEYNMTYSSQVAFDGVVSTNTNTKIGAFIGNECRGFALLTYEAALDVYVFHLTIYSNEPAGEAVVLKVFDPAKSWLYKKPLTFTFGSDEAEGDVDDVLNCLSQPAK